MSLLHGLGERDRERRLAKKRVIANEELTRFSSGRVEVLVLVETYSNDSSRLVARLDKKSFINTYIVRLVHYGGDSLTAITQTVAMMHDKDCHRY